MTALDVLCAKARLNAAVWRAREELASARAGSVHARAEMRAGRRSALVPAAEREARAEGALADAVTAWCREARGLSVEGRAALPERIRHGGGGTVGATFPDALAALAARFGDPDRVDGPRSNDTRGAYWTRDVWTEERPRMRCAWRNFGVCEDFVDGRGGARVRVFGSASGSAEWGGCAEVEAIVGVEAQIARDILNTHLNPGFEVETVDPGPWRPYPAEPHALKVRQREDAHERARWRAWNFDAPLDAAGLVRRTEAPRPLIAPLARALDAVALMLAVPQPREVLA